MFKRPVDHGFPIKAYFGQKDRRFSWSMDPDNGLWLPAKDAQGMGQHRGTDFDCPIGTLIRAMADGFIVRCRYGDPRDHKIGPGLYILQLVNLLGYDSWMLRYAHLSAIFVKAGQRVQRDQPIAESGNSGDVLSPYLHVDLVDLRHRWKAIPLEN